MPVARNQLQSPALAVETRHERPFTLRRVLLSLVTLMVGVTLLPSAALLTSTTATAAEMRPGSHIKEALADESPAPTLTIRVTMPAGYEETTYSLSVSSLEGTQAWSRSWMRATEVSLDSLPAGTAYRVDLRPDDTALLPASAVVAAGAPLLAGQTAAVALQPLLGSTISGVITLPDGNPAQGKVVWAYAYLPDDDVWQGLRWTRVAPDGTYVLDGLMDGTYRVKIQEIPLPGQWYGNVEQENEALPITLGERDDVTGIDIALRAGATLSGRIVVPNGALLGPGKVCLRPTTTYGGHGGCVWSADIDDNTREFTLKRIPAGNYILVVLDRQVTGPLDLDFFEHVFPRSIRRECVAAGTGGISISRNETLGNVLIPVSPITSSVDDPVFDLSGGSVPVTDCPEALNDPPAVAPPASPTPAKPSIRRLATPKVSGNPRVGRTLRVSKGRWKPASGKITLRYQWFRKTDGRKFRVKKGKTATLKLRKTLRGHRLRVRVTVSAPGHRSVTYTSKWSRKVR